MPAVCARMPPQWRLDLEAPDVCHMLTVRRATDRTERRQATHPSRARRSRHATRRYPGNLIRRATDVAQDHVGRARQERPKPSAAVGWLGLRPLALRRFGTSWSARVTGPPSTPSARSNAPRCTSACSANCDRAISRPSERTWSSGQPAGEVAAAVTPATTWMRDGRKSRPPSLARTPPRTAHRQRHGGSLSLSAACADAREPVSRAARPDRDQFVVTWPIPKAP